MANDSVVPYQGSNQSSGWLAATGSAVVVWGGKLWTCGSGLAAQVGSFAAANPVQTASVLIPATGSAIAWLKFQSDQKNQLKKREEEQRRDAEVLGSLRRGQCPELSAADMAFLRNPSVAQAFDEQYRKCYGR